MSTEPTAIPVSAPTPLRLAIASAAAVGFGYSETCSSICWRQRSFTFGSILFGTRPSSWTQKETASNLGRFNVFS
jgi:hypothetical protein